MPDLKRKYSRSDIKNMTMQFLDSWVPAILFLYGTILFLVLDVFPLPEKLIMQYTELHNQLKMHQSLSRLCLFAGGAWLLQNLML